jgi:nucleoside-diphosphate-sugar epimerase
MSVLYVILGTGAIGRATADELLQRGRTVRMVNRTGKMPEAPAGVELVASDLYDQAKVREVTRGAKVVYQCAQPPYDQWQAKFPALQTAILDGLTGSGAKLVIVENLYMFGETNGTPMTETLPFKARTRKGRTRAEMSEAALLAHAAGKVRVTIGRGSDFFGPWGLGSSMGARAFFPLLQGKAAQMIGRLDIPHTCTYTLDFGKALAILGERAEADGQAWNVPNDRPEISQAEMIRIFAEQAGMKPRASAMNKPMMALGGLFVPEARETVEMMYEFEQPFIVDSGKFEQTFGMKATPVREALRTTVNWYKNHMELQHG